MTKPLLLLVVLSISSTIQTVHAHGHAFSPRSRNWRAHEEGREYDHNGLNRKSDASNTWGSGLCGKVGGNNYDTFLDSHGGWNTEATYGKGDTIEITSHISAYHGGHIEVNACADSSPTQSCFDSNKLKYKTGGSEGNPKDSSYPYRAYLGGTHAGPGSFTHKFELPSNLTGERVLLQWRYFTANSCRYEGYDAYYSSQGWNLLSTGMCNSDILDDDGGNVPERFWNCIEVSINGNPEMNPNTSNNNPTPAPPSPTPAPPTPSPPTSDQPCGNGNVNSGYCADASLCCSEWGWCDDTHAHCSTDPNHDGRGRRTRNKNQNLRRARRKE